MKGHALRFVLLFGILFFLSTLLATGKVLAADADIIDPAKVSGTADKADAFLRKMSQFQ